jgi:toxin ParE1/3/4
VAQAETYLRQIWQHVELIAAHPALGQACPDIRAGYRKYKSGAHIL